MKYVLRNARNKRVADLKGSVRLAFIPIHNSRKDFLFHYNFPPEVNQIIIDKLYRETHDTTFDIGSGLMIFVIKEMQ